MPDRSSLWGTVKSWFVERTEQVTVRFLPDRADGRGSGDENEPATLSAPIAPNAGYFRLYVAEGFLASRKSWTAQHYPALHGGVVLSFGGADRATFTTLARPPENWTVPGAQMDFPITPLLPFTGGTVELEGALYQATVDGPLGTAVGLVSSLAGLMGPPLANAAALAGRLSEGLDTVVKAAGNQPVLGVHWTLVAPGGGGRVLRPGSLVLLNQPEKTLPGTPVIADGRLRLRTGTGLELPEGVDYLVLRVEGRTERDDWRQPELDAVIRAAGEALIRGQEETYRERRTEALARAWNNTDLVAPDRKRVALMVRQELDDLRQFGAVPAEDRPFEVRAATGLPAADDVRLTDLTLESLLTT